MTEFGSQVAEAIDAAYPPRITGESSADYEQRAKKVVAANVAAALVAADTEALIDQDAIVTTVPEGEHRARILAILRGGTP